MLEFLLIIIGSSILVGLILWFANYMTHIEMNKKEKLPYDFVTFNTFIAEFNKYKDNPNLTYNKSYNSFFLYKKTTSQSGITYEYAPYECAPEVYIHADIIRFNNKCMILYPIDYLKFCFWRFALKKKYVPSNRQKGLWDNV